MPEKSWSMEGIELTMGRCGELSIHMQPETVKKLVDAGQTMRVMVFPSKKTIDDKKDWTSKGNLQNFTMTSESGVMPFVIGVARACNLLRHSV